MSDYGYDDSSSRRHRSMRTRDREPEYVQETTYIQRGPGRPSTDLVYRGRDDSIEDIPRDFPPQAEFRRTRYRDDYGVRRSRSVGRRDDYDDDYYSDGGTAYGRSRRGGRERRYHDDDYQSDDYYEPHHDRRKSKFEGILDDLGLGGAVAAVTGSRSRSRGPRSRRGSFESERSTRTRGGGESRKKWQQAATAALLTGAAEAWRSRKEPGGLTGAKGRRIATAALSAAGFDAILDKNPHEKSKRHIAESVVAGLVTNRIANGPRDRSASRGRSRDRDGDDERSRSRSRFSLRSLSRGRFGRSQSREPDGSQQQQRRGSGLKDLAAAGGIAAIGKAIYDRVRSKSRGRDRDPSRSRSPSEDSYVPTRQQRYRRNRGAPTDDNRVARPRGHEDGGGERKRDSSSDSISTTDLENQRKRTRGPTGAYPPTAYADGNPYAAIPPPPMGSPRQSRY